MFLWVKGPIVFLCMWLVSCSRIHLFPFVGRQFSMCLFLYIFWKLWNTLSVQGCWILTSLREMQKVSFVSLHMHTHTHEEACWELATLYYWAVNTWTLYFSVFIFIFYICVSWSLIPFSLKVLLTKLYFTHFWFWGINSYIF